jgi:predicted MFS family arabinose efflux permease
VLCARTRRGGDRELLRLTAMARRATSPSVHAIGAAQLVAWGATYYAIPPLLPRISADLSVATSTLAIGMTVGLVIHALAALAVARWIQRRGARVPMLVGSSVATCALVLLASSPAPAVAVIALAILGTSQAALLYEPAFAAVAAQSATAVERTRAVQVITFWGGWAAAWALPSSSLLAGSIGWRATLFVLAALLAAVTLRVHAKLPPPAVRRSATTSLRGPAISLRLAAAFALGSFATTAIVVNGVLLLVERRVSIDTASVVLALLAPLQIAGRVWFMRRHGRLARHDGLIPFVLAGAGMLALLAAPSVLALAAFVVLFGAGTGLVTTIRAALVISRVPAEHVAGHLAAYSLLTNLARAFAPAGSIGLHLSVGYELALVTFALLAITAAALVWCERCGAASL